MRERRSWPLWAAGLVLLWASLGTLVSLAAPGVGLCLFRRLTGLPCPACGTGRAMLLLAGGDPAGAMLQNPLAGAAAAVLVAEALARLIRGRGLLPRAAAASRLAPFVLAGLVALNWAYVLLRTE